MSEWVGETDRLNPAGELWACLEKTFLLLDCQFHRPQSPLSPAQWRVWRRLPSAHSHITDFLGGNERDESESRLASVQSWLGYEAAVGQILRTDFVNGSLPARSDWWLLAVNLFSTSVLPLAAHHHETKTKDGEIKQCCGLVV